MKKTAITIIGWVISAALLASLATRLDFHKLLNGLTQVSLPYLVAAAVVNFVVVALKALRWKWLMEPKGSTSYSSILSATLIGMAGNNVLPARGGDWMKIYFLGKWAGAGKAKLASVTGLDKLFDGIAILLLFWVFSFHSTFPSWVKQGTSTVSVVIAVSLVISVLLLVHHRRIDLRQEENLTRLSRLASRLGSGMSALASHRLVIATLINSIVICILQVATIWCCQKAFDLKLDIWIPALVFVAINLAIIVPSAPSGVGPFEAAAVLAYAWLHINTETAFNIALMYHAVQFFPVTIAGFICYVYATRHGLRARELTVEER